MLFPDRMVRSMDRILHVSQDRVHPPEVRLLTAFGSASSDLGLENASGLGHSPEGSQSVRDHHRRSGEMLPGPAVGHRFAKTGHSGQPKAHGTTVRGAGAGRHERRLSESTLSPLSAVSFPAPVGVIDLNEAVQRAAVVPLLHHVKNLVRKTPGGEGKLRSREYRSGRERGLMVAGMGLTPSDRQQAETVVVTGQTVKPLGATDA